MFRFPHDPKLKAKWIKHLYRKPIYKPNKNSRVCSLHFLPEDLTYESVDTKESRKKSRKGPTRYLKYRPGAYPRVHENLPTYFTSLPGPSRTTSASSEARIDKENRDIIKQMEQIEQQDLVKFEDLLKPNYVPQVTGFVVIVHEKKVIFMQLKMDPPTIISCLEISEDMKFTLSLRGSFVNKNHVKHIISAHRDHISKHSEINNILAELKSWSDPSPGKADIFV